MSDMSRRIAPATQTAQEAARHICEEARVVLTSLRSGPPAVARGELAQDLMDLRFLVKDKLEKNAMMNTDDTAEEGTSLISRPPDNSPGVIPNAATPLEDDEGAVLVHRSDAQMYATSALPQESPMPKSRICNFTPVPPQVREFGASTDPSNPRSFLSPEHVGMYAHPFLAVVMDPRAAGPHTLVALRALFRLLERGSLVEPNNKKHDYHVNLEPLMKGVLACKFEQTDAGADEAVEMAIADLLALLVALNQEAFVATTLMDAFNTVFVTRNTFVHSPALCYHFEDVLASMVVSVFENISSSKEEAARLILEFLVNQLLHTPLMGGEGLDDAAREAQVAHDATRVLCLRLTRCCLRAGWGRVKDDVDESKETKGGVPLLPTLEDRTNNKASKGDEPEAAPFSSSSSEDRPLLRIIQDDLCLSLLMTGQAIWAYHDSNTNISPGFISLEVLSEICATMSTLWNTVSLRRHLVEQFEKIYTGFYQRALVLLRKRANAEDPISFNANLAFDAEVEIILESLVDLLSLHECTESSPTKRKSALETLFATYDCSLSHADVATLLMVELCRCCGGIINDEGEAVLGRTVSPPPESKQGGETGAAARQPISHQSSRVSVQSRSDSIQIDNLREVPAHLKELCAEALSGSIRSLCRADPTISQTSFSGLSTVPEQGRVSPTVDVQDQRPQELDSPYQEERLRAQFAAGSVSLRYIKSQKQLLRRAAKLFNQKASKGIEFLLTSGLIPDPVTPASVAGFLRNGLVVGLDKAAVGSYLGESGKPPAAGKSPPIWERDWFHKEVLEAYCTLFRFEGQSLLDGLRMFLAAFRLPGEGQQIDRIIQAFAESCGRVCDESVRLRLFSDDPKRASDPAFLLAYSIIMLTTDLHNKNIRPDRKMSLEAFIRNNTNYGRDITEPGKELPRDFLVGVYESIRDEEIRTEGEGAEGHMTVERWKDVLRGSAGEDPSVQMMKNNRDDSDLKEVVVETLWQPVLSAVGAFWGKVNAEELGAGSINPESSPNMMLGAQGARLGMDMAVDILEGVRSMNRIDIFQQIFSHVCQYTGLLEYRSDAVDRTWAFVNSVEAQSAVVVAVKMAREAGDDVGLEGWYSVWGIVFELRDLKLLGGVRTKRTSMLMESEPDLLTESARREWNMWLVKGDVDVEAELAKARQKGSSLFGALFGSSSEPRSTSRPRRVEVQSGQGRESLRTVHAKEELVLWDELAPSDDEGDAMQDDSMDVDTTDFKMQPALTAGMAFENQLIQEDMLLQQQTDTSVPVTGLERVEDTWRYQISPRARVRKRLLRTCDFAGLIAESRFMDQHGFECLLSALVGLVANGTKGRIGDNDESGAGDAALPLSPASEAFAEVLIAEVAIKNRDRLANAWQLILKEHYTTRLSRCEKEQVGPAPVKQSNTLPEVETAGIEKCVTGLLRICACAVLRGTLPNEITCSLSLLHPTDTYPGPLGSEHLDKHLGEGVWRICQNVDGLSQLSQDGWDALFGLIEWCASVGDRSMPVMVDPVGKSGGLAEDNPALQAYRSLHVMLHAPDLREIVPFSVVHSIRALIATGERVNFPKLSIAGLDLIQIMHNRMESEASSKEEGSEKSNEDGFWVDCWMPLLEGTAEAAKYSQYSAVRQHAISMLTDSFIDKYGRLIPPYYFCQAMPRICIPLAGARITEMLRDELGMMEQVEEVMIEFELCISLLFKPLLHHLKSILVLEADFLAVWTALLRVLEGLLIEGVDGDDAASDHDLSPQKLRLTTKQLACEHLRNAVMVLIASGVLKGAVDSGSKDISSVTWDSIAKMTFCKDMAEEWKQSAM